MNAREFIDKVGHKKAKAVAQEAGTSYEYLKQIANGHRRPSIEMADALVAASGYEMDFMDLIKRPGVKPASRK